MNDPFFNTSFLFIDKSKSFIDSNNIRVDLIFNVFIVNKNNEVIFSGNPLKSKEIEEKFIGFIKYIDTKQ